MVGLFALPRHALTQSGYYNLDASRPLRVDDATPTDRFAFELMLAPFRAERYPDGLMRYRAEPKLSFGVLPRTDVEVRVPLIRVQPGGGAAAATGLTSIGLGATHALTLEGERMPAAAIGGEWLLPVGNLSAPGASYALKGMFTKTFSEIRLHLNVGGGTYSVQPTSSGPGCVPPPQGRILPPTGVTYCSDTNQRRIVTDVPCGADPEGGETAAAAGTVEPIVVPSVGTRTFLGLGIDHAFVRSSTLVMADVTSERFVGLYPTPDLTIEFGIRHQLSPWLILDAGIARKVYGSAPYSAVTVGATYEGSVAGVRFCSA
jgi:hypothetical protein